MSSSDSFTTIDALPNEVLVDILRPFSTKDLLPLASVNHRFHLVVARLLHRRLLDVASLPQNDLILECYHPSAKISTPYLRCQYLNTTTRGGDEVGANGNEPVLADLGRLYSSFRPALAEENRTQRARYRFSAINGPGSPVDDTATEDIYLDEGELFAQLCAVVNLVSTGLRLGLFFTRVNISDGILRVWRDWLADMEQGQASGDGILWVDNHQGVGVRFRVTPGPTDTPIICGPDDHPPVGYQLQYEELLVRTRMLLLAVEKSTVQVSHSAHRVATTYDTLRVPPFKLFAKNPRNTWLPESSHAFDRVLSKQI